MAQASTEERVSSDELEEGDEVTVYVNRRAEKQLETRSFKATVTDAFADDVTFKPHDQIQKDFETHTWYSDIGYIHGFHSGLGRYSDIGKVTRVTR